MNDTPRARAIVIRNGSVLLIHRVRDGAEYYVVPGGGVEGTETLEEAALRELKEETGLDARVGRILFRNSDDRGRQHTFFLMEQAKGEPTFSGAPENLQPESGTYALEWIPIARLFEIPLEPSEIKDVLLHLSHV